MRIVVLDGYTLNPGDNPWSELETMGDLTVYDRTPEAEILTRANGAHAVFVNKTPLGSVTLAALPSLQYIGVLATGYDVVDTKAASAAEICVTNVPAYGTETVAQFAIALLLEITSRVGHHDQAVKQGRWTTCPDWCFWDYPLMELASKTMAIIGFGRIGQATGRIAKALGMRVLAVDEYPNEPGRAIAEYVPLDNALPKADVVCLHCNLTPATQGIIRQETIEKMKNGVIIINNSRGPLVVEADLADALNSGKVYAAAVDVVSKEPISPDNPLLKAKNCIITPHMSWATLEARQNIMRAAAENLAAWVAGKPKNVVNP